MTDQEFSRLAQSPQRIEEHSTAVGCDAVVLDLSHTQDALPAQHKIATTIIGYGDPAQEQPACDVIVQNEEDVEPLLKKVEAQPRAAYVLTQVLRHNEKATIASGLLAESLAYSNLLHSQDFLAWHAADNPHRTHKPTTEPLLLERQEATLKLTLNRAEVHNAYDTDLKDALCNALQLALLDHTIDELHLHGAGPSFCAGGDLSEFGKTIDPTQSHISRTTRSAAHLMGQLECDTYAHLHGACIGAGIEISAFAKNIIAAKDSFIQLPEVAMGLIPGAGGTVSIPRRIGRQRTALLALSGERLSAYEAKDMGLVDRLTG